jgi:uncharacterized membrane protein YfcA
MALPSLAGAIAGALLLLAISERNFKLLVPWLILAATLLFLLSDRLQAIGDRPEARPAGLRLAGLLFVQFLVAIYGGFFGAGQSILMLASLGFSGLRDIDRMNGLKSFAGTIINGVASAMFVWGGLIAWRPAIIMSVAAVFGGYTGAHFSQRIGKTNARRAVIWIGLCTAAASFYQLYQSSGTSVN